MQLSEPWGGALGILWVDLETTGSDETKDDIIEIGAVYTDFELNLISDFTCVIEPCEYALGRLMKTPVVREMHTKNGLLDDCISSSERHPDIRRGETALLNWLDSTINRGKQR